MCKLHIIMQLIQRCLHHLRHIRRWGYILFGLNMLRIRGCYWWRNQGLLSKIRCLTWLVGQIVNFYFSDLREPPRKQKHFRTLQQRLATRRSHVYKITSNSTQKFKIYYQLSIPTICFIIWGKIFSRDNHLIYWYKVTSTWNTNSSSFY